MPIRALVWGENVHERTSQLVADIYPDGMHAAIATLLAEDKGISVKRKTVPAAELKASQMQLDGPKVAGMSKAMEAGKIPDAPIFVTKDGYILDGHHRWAAKVAIDVKDGKLGDVNMPVDIIDIEIGEAIDLANAFTAQQGIVPKGLGKDAEGVAAPKA